MPPTQYGDKVYRFNGFCLNARERQLTFNDAPVAMPPKTYDALLTLVENAGRLVSKQDLHEYLWPKTFVEDVTLARIISDLRQILARHTELRHIQTVPKHGYRFVAPVSSSHANSSAEHLAGDRAQRDEAGQLVRRAWYAIRRWSPDAVTEALTHVRRAIAANPSCAEAHAVMAYIYLYAGFGFLPGNDAFPRARAAATTALRLDPGCAPAYAVLAMQTLVHGRDLENAEQYCRKAIELAPEGMPGHFAYSHLLLVRGQLRAALDEGIKALDADPLSCSVAYHLASVLYYAGECEDAVAQLLKFKYLDPDFLGAHQLLAILYARLDRHEDALKEASIALQLSGNNARGKATLAIVSALTGMPAEARLILRELEEDRAVPGFRFSYARAIIHTCLGDRDAAFECLSQACEEGDAAVVYLRYDPHFVALRDDERFAEVLSRLGF